MEDDSIDRRGGGLLSGCFKLIAGALIVVLMLGAAFWFLGDALKKRFLAPDPVTVATSSLEGLREQNRLSTFAASYVAVVTSTQTRMGLVARKTLIMPGSVRYEVDLSKLEQSDLAWDAATNTLSIQLPPVEVMGPEVDMARIREYGDGGVLMALTNAEDQIDAANRAAGQAELMRQARGPVNMRLARDSTRRAVERSFSMPLRAAGMNATVEVTFADEPRRSTERWDTTRTPAEVLNSR